MNLKKTILLVNANTLQLQEYAQFLSKQGLNIIVSTQFNLAIDITEIKKPHFLILFVQKNDVLLDYDVYLKNTNKLIVINNNNSLQLNKKISDTVVIENKLIDKEKLYDYCIDKQISNIGISNRDLRILLVEDNKLNQLYYSEIIAQLNIQYNVCEGISDAITLIKNYNFNLIISDVVLNDGNGIELLKIVYAEQKINTPFIIISGFSEKDLKVKYGNFNCDHVLMKPLTKTTLKSSIIKCLKLVSIENELNTPYDFKEIIPLLKNDKNKIAQCVKDFNEKLDQAVNLIDTVIENKKFDKISDAFHDILNLSQYFGAKILFDLIMKYREEKTSTKKIEILTEIKKELNLVSSFYKHLEYT